MTSTIALLLLITIYPLACFSCKNPFLIVFGDSNSDTGGKLSFLGYVEYGPPYGRVFPEKPSGRATDGRLILDYFCEHLNIGYLSSYLNSFYPNFNRGVNFAIGGAKVGNGDPFNGSSTVFTLYLQSSHFQRFRNLSIEREKSQGMESSSVSENRFHKALYMIDLGQNDMSGFSDNNASYEQIITNIPAIISEVEKFIRGIHGIHGRKFWIHNTSPQGCFPFQKARAANNTELDAHGCIKYLNAASQKFNEDLSQLIQKLRVQLTGVTIVLVDIYSAKYELITNSLSYGFMDPFSQCVFGQTEYCVDASHYISFDGTHLTDTANAIVAKMILSGRYSDPPLQFDFFCT